MTVATSIELPWTDTDHPGPAMDLLCGLAADKARLRRLIEQVADDPRLLGLSECSESFDKLVLAVDKVSGCRLRLHRFDPEFADTPHNHRYSFWSVLLSGSYVHTVYGSGRDALRLPRGRLPISRFAAVFRPGDLYGLHHSMVHTATSVARGTYSLMLRGPKVKVKDDLYKVDANGDPVAPDVPRPLVPEHVRVVVAELSTSGVL